MNNTPKNSRSITVRNTSPQEVAEFIREVNGKEIRKFKIVYDDGRIEQKRLFVNGDRIGYLRLVRRNADIFSICRAFTLFPVIYRRKLTGMHSLSGMRNG